MSVAQNRIQLNSTFSGLSVPPLKKKENETFLWFDLTDEFGFFTNWFISDGAAKP